MPVNKQNYEGESPLSMAVMNGSYETVISLLESGANVNAANIRSETPLHLAACFGYVDICKELLRYGGWIDTEDDCGDTPLHWAVREEQREVIELLLNCGADPNHLNEDDESPQMLAESVSSESIVNVFDSIAASDMDTDLDAEANGFIFMNSSEFLATTKRPSISVNDESSIDVELSDDSIGRSGNIEIDISSSGTVYPSSLGKEDEYIHVAGKPVNNIHNHNLNNNICT